MNLFARLIIFFVFGALLVYLLFPVNEFPDTLPDTIQSREPGDSLDIAEPAYFANQSRQEVITYYRNQFSHLPTLRLNYPPEETALIIREQIRASYLEEIVQPFRSSLFVSGFIPIEAKDEIWYDGKNFEQKVTLKYVPSSLLSRLVFYSMTLLSTFLLMFSWRNYLDKLHGKK